MPPSPNLQDRLPLPQTTAVPPQQTASRTVPTSHHSTSLDPDQAHSIQEHVRSQGNPRVPSGPDPRSHPVLDNSIASAVPPSHMSLHSPRRISSGHDSGGRHHLPAMGPMPPVHQYENTRAHPHSNSHASSPIHHSHPPSSHTRNRSPSRSHIPLQSYRSGGTSHRHQFPESLPPAQQTLHSPPLSERERSRRNDHHDYVGPQGEFHAYDHRQPHHQLSPRTQPVDGRPSDRLHTHQRLGAYNREGPHDRRREPERESEWELEERRRRDPRSVLFGSETLGHEPIPNSYSPPPPPHKSRLSPDRGHYELHAASRSREDQGYYQDIHAPSGYPRLSRSGTPASGSGRSGSGSGAGPTEMPSRPDSRAQYHERDHPRSFFRLRPVSQPSDDIDFVHEDGRLQNRTSSDRSAAVATSGSHFAMSEQSRTSLDSRKRSRNDVDSDNEVGDGPSGGAGPFPTGRLQEDRSSKRYHREHPRQSVDNHEDGRESSS